MNARLRTIVESPNVSKELDGQEDSELAQALFDGLVWRLARRPDQGVEIPDSACYQIFLGDDDEPKIAAVYSFDEDRVKILAISFPPTVDLAVD